MINSKCAWCHKPITKSDYNIKSAFCSKECKTKYYMSSDMETYETDDVKCPYCGAMQSDIFEGGYYEADEDIFECDECEKKFILTAYTSTSFTANPTPEEIDKIYNERND